MVSVTKLRIKFGHEGSVKTFHNFSVLNTCNNAKKLEESISEDVIKAANQSKKRGFDEIEEAQAKDKKKRKLNIDMSSKCFTVLGLLRDHEHGWIFSEPVDPVRLKIPDYFSVVSKPMDLGTIKSKLSKSVYGNADGFAGDVRLTFTNAMMYNPPDNMVHKMAKELKEVFEARWASMKKEKDMGVSKIEVRECSKRQPETSVKEKSEKFSLSLKPVKIHIISDTPPVTHKVLPTKVRIKKLDQGIRVSSTVKTTCKDSASTKACICGSRMACVCFKSCNSFGSEASSLTDCEVMNTSGVQASVSDPHSNGSISSKNDKNSCVSSQLEIPIVPSMPPLPPEKALRAAMLKAQFAETILRAKHGKSLDQSNKADLTRIQIEKQQMQKSLREEKARIEAEMKAAKIATRIKAETELRLKRERQRLQLEKMEKTFDFEENNVLRLREEMVKLCGSSNPTRTLLLKLGLFLRIDDDVEEIESELRKEDLEEGEISL